MIDQLKNWPWGWILLIALALAALAFGYNALTTDFIPGATGT